MFCGRPKGILPLATIGPLGQRRSGGGLGGFAGSWVPEDLGSGRGRPLAGDFGVSLVCHRYGLLSKQRLTGWRRSGKRIYAFRAKSIKFLYGLGNGFGAGT